MNEAQLIEVERLCNIIYAATEPAAMKDAQMQVLQLQSSAEFVPQCQFILDNTKLNYAQLLASNSLEALMSKFWTSFSLEQKLEIRNYVLNYLASHFVDEFVLTSLLKLMCRITKLGWFDGPQHRDIIKDVTKFLGSGPDHHVIGLKLLNSLIEEMNIQNPSRTLTQHRKTAVSFRDHALFSAFQLGINTLKQVMASNSNNPNNNNSSKPNNGDLSLCALRLTSSCLSYDFIGTNPEESGEDIGTVQVPTAWRPVVSDTNTMKLFFDLYHSTSPPCSQLALKSLVQMTSVRRSLFASEKERTDFLCTLMSGIMTIMEYVPPSVSVSPSVYLCLPLTLFIANLFLFLPRTLTNHPSLFYRYSCYSLCE